MTYPLTSQNAMSELLRRVPAFAEARASDSSFLSHEEATPYLLFGDLGLFLSKHLQDRSGELADKNMFLIDGNNFSNLQEFYAVDRHYHIRGDWGELEIVSSPPMLQIENT